MKRINLIVFAIVICVFISGYKTEEKKSIINNIEIEKACADKHFLNFNDEGFSPKIQQFLEKKFPKPSIYEK